VLLGLGMGLVMSPMSTAAMNAVDRTKAGVASGIVSMSRMIGGTFGVAALGALITGLGKSKLDDTLPNVPAAQRQHLADALGAGGGTQAKGQIGDAVREAYVYALNNGLRIAAVADRAEAPAEAGAEGAAAGPAEAKPELVEAA
jgi:hypothetical protein